MEESLHWQGRLGLVRPPQEVEAPPVPVVLQEAVTADSTATLVHSALEAMLVPITVEVAVADTMAVVVPTHVPGVVAPIMQRALVGPTGQG